MRDSRPRKCGSAKRRSAWCLQCQWKILMCCAQYARIMQSRCQSLGHSVPRIRALCCDGMELKLAGLTRILCTRAFLRLCAKRYGIRIGLRKMLGLRDRARSLERSQHVRFRRQLVRFYRIQISQAKRGSFDNMTTKFKGLRSSSRSLELAKAVQEMRR